MLYRHNYPHAHREVEGRGDLLAYDPTCGECARVGFCTWCQGPCQLDASPAAPPELDERDPFDTLREDPFEDEPDTEPVYSWTEACPRCGEVHPS